MPSLCTLYPNRLTVFPEPRHRTINDLLDRKVAQWEKTQIEYKYRENFKVQKKSFELSPATKKKLFESINTMYELSTPRNINMKSGKTIYNFRMSFITLTLPSVQRHSDIELKNNCLNQLLVELRRYYKFHNYIWKAELQSNGNLHFHILSDCYVDYQALRRRWNRILSKLGYVDRYQERMGNLSLSDYHKLRNLKKSYSFQSSAAAYAQGKKSNWKNPNSVDVRSVNSKKSLAGYLAKYISKASQKSELSESDQERLRTFGRSFGRSQSLSRLRYKHRFLYEDLKGLIDIFKNSGEAVHTYVGEWCTVFYFRLDQLDKGVSKWISKMIRINAQHYSYPFP